MNWNWEEHLSQIITKMGLTGARSHRNYEVMCETWINSEEPIPTIIECIGIFESLVKPNLEEAYIKQKFNDDRRNAYDEAGVTFENMVVAQWENDVEGRPEAMKELQKKRLIVKSKIPKPK